MSISVQATVTAHDRHDRHDRRGPFTQYNGSTAVITGLDIYPGLGYFIPVFDKNLYRLECVSDS